MTTLKERLRAGETIAVCNPDYPTPRMVEFIGTLGFDAIFIDCEHASTDFALVEELARAARSADLATVVRPWSNEEGLVNRYLSCGVDGVQTPHVQSRAEAKAIVEGIARWEGDHTAKLLVAMIESEQAIAALPEMLNIDEIDVFYIGAVDLAQSMGLKGNPGHARVRAAVDATIEIIAGSGRVAGMNVQGDLDAVARYRGLGLHWINVHLKTFVSRGARSFIDNVRGPL
ncbi:aldolase/citrate lyase family protein [Bosea sp. 117]|uniref:HpcH/HpaI aldolase family protein n=1 Tax=Bosea sp. 117 TaxID=1125973 RepID=UPI00069002E3|nr:aldolase/citrate lyase family protein [Bosea sp. 117]